MSVAFPRHDINGSPVRDSCRRKVAAHSEFDLQAKRLNRYGPCFVLGHFNH